ncbi:type II toxin-antitoxin system RelE/ParE family toxin [Azospirillum argentinense]
MRSRRRLATCDGRLASGGACRPRPHPALCLAGKSARRLAQELVLAGDSLQVFPRRGRRGLVEGTRELVVVRPYVIVYDIGEDETVSILRLWHSAQDRG